MSPNVLNPFQLLELNIISAQDLKVVGRNMKTYAVAWVHPDRKLTTRVDGLGHNNPTWNDKFVFRVDDQFLHGDTSAVMIEIYAVSWLRDVHVGTVRIIVGNLIPPPSPHSQHIGMRFVALQVRRRSSGRPQGLLNIGVAILDSSMRSMPLYTQLSASAVGYRQMMDGGDRHCKQPQSGNNSYVLPLAPKEELRRTKSDSSSLVAPFGHNTTKERATSEVSGTTKRKAGSVVNVNGSLLFGSLTKGKYSSDIGLGIGPSEIDVGPSASEAAAANRRRAYAKDEGSDIVGEWNFDSMEGMHSKLDRWRAELPSVYEDADELSSVFTVGRKKMRRRSRSHGELACFSNVCGLQCSIVCGGDASSTKRPRQRRSPSTYSMSSYY